MEDMKRRLIENIKRGNMIVCGDSVCGASVCGASVCGASVCGVCAGSVCGASVCGVCVATVYIQFSYRELKLNNYPTQ